MRKRLAIARALIHRPSVLILDEPTAGLDPQGVEDVWRILRELPQEHITVLMATHNMLEAERLPTRLLLIDEGRLIAQGTAQEIMARAKAGRTAVLTLGSRPKIDDGLLIQPLDDGKFSLVVPVDRLPAILSELQQEGVQLENVEIKETGLWEAFLRLTGRPFDDMKKGDE